MKLKIKLFKPIEMLLIASFAMALIFWEYYRGELPLYTLPFVLIFLIVFGIILTVIGDNLSYFVRERVKKH